MVHFCNVANPIRPSHSESRTTMLSHSTPNAMQLIFILIDAHDLSNQIK